MTNSVFKNTKISGVVTCVPNKKVFFEDDALSVGFDAKQISRIKKNIGLNQRHVTEANQTSLDLCLYAAEDLMKGLKLDKNEIDALIFVTQTPDHFQPCNAAITHGKLGLSKKCASFDINLGCSGYVYGLWIASMMIETNSCKKVLLLAGDTLSKCVNKKDRSAGFLFGDGGSATIIESSVSKNEMFFSLNTDGSGSDFIKIPAGGFRMPKSDETSKEFTTEDGNTFSDENLIMNGAEVFNFSISEEPNAIKELIKFSQKNIEDIDYFIFHQANKYILSNIARRLKVSNEKVPMGTVEKFGNQSSVSIPCTINNSIGHDLVSNNKSVILSGFGVGLSWASCIATLNLEYCPKVLVCKE
tara:strand:- start:10582 stop:11655 length:1074 start_codon:yes stop_codon:yes gene_type:complete